MSRYWGYEYQGKGLAPVTPDANLTLGLRIAEGAAAIRLSQPVPKNPMQTNYDVLVAGLLEAYAWYIWPEWKAKYQVVGVEQELTRALSPELTYQARPDALLKDADGRVWYLEDKTTSQAAGAWAKGWDKQVQLHVTAAIAGAVGIIVQGWAKGYEKEGSIYSPLCFAWSRTASLGKGQWSATYKPGWGRTRVDRYPGGVEAWVHQLPQALILAQFPTTMPILVRPDLVEAFFAQTTRREAEIAAGTEFAQHFNQCDEYGKYRRPCAFRECCWAPTVGRDPVGSGLYSWRVPHHAAEAEAR